MKKLYAIVLMTASTSAFAWETEFERNRRLFMQQLQQEQFIEQQQRQQMQQLELMLERQREQDRLYQQEQAQRMLRDFGRSSRWY